MSDAQVYFFDTNVLLDWLYKEISSYGVLLEKFVNSLRRDQCAVHGITLTEVERIINDAYNVTAHIIHEEILLKVAWDSLNVKERVRVINEIEKEFERKYEEIRKRHYSGTIPRSTVRLLLAKMFFKSLEDRLIEMRGEDVRMHFPLTRRPDDIRYYVRNIKVLIAEKCTIIYDIRRTIINNDITEKKKELISQAIRRYILKSKQKGYKKSPSRYDDLIFTDLYLLVDRGVYSKIIFVTNDVDFKGMYESTIEYLDEILSRGAQVGDDTISYAKEAREILAKRLSIKSVREVLAEYRNE